MRKAVLVLSLLAFTLVFTPVQASAFNFPSFNFPFPIFSPRPSHTPKPSPQIKIKEIKIDGEYKPKKNQVNLSFGNLDSVKQASFLLTYTHQGIEEGIMDALPGGVKKIKKDVFLGTCSAGVCKPHTNSKDIKLKVDGFYNNNQPFSKTIDIK